MMLARQLGVTLDESDDLRSMCRKLESNVDWDSFEERKRRALTHSDHY